MNNFKEKLFELFSDKDGIMQTILQGGENLKDFACGLVNCCIGTNNIQQGGAIVPQMGAGAGCFLEFCNPITRKNNIIYSHLKECWQKRLLVTQKIDLKSDNFLFYVPLSIGFDRPIGYFWVIDKDDTYVKSLEFAAYLYCSVIKNEKTSRSLFILSQPIWQIASSKNIAIELAGKTALDTVSANASIIWLSEGNYLKTEYCSYDTDVSLDMSISDGVAGKMCYKTGRAYVVDNFKNEINVKHLKVIREKKWQSGIFVPLDEGSEIIGVLAVYGIRKNAFSKIDENIITSIAHLLVAGLIKQSRLEQLKQEEEKITKILPFVETGMLAMERVHDIRNRLFSAINTLNKISEKFDKSRRNEPIYIYAQEACEKIQESDEIIKALVKRGKLENKNLKIQCINTIIESILTSFEDVFKDNKISIKYEYNEECYAYIDKLNFERIFQNLIDNAIFFLKMVHRNKEIKVKVTSIDNNKILISIVDNGTGIPKEKMTEIFSFFYTTKGEQGLGFGLPIVKRILSSFGGDIRVYSEWGKFTRFEISIPKVKEKN